MISLGAWEGLGGSTTVRAGSRSGEGWMVLRDWDLLRCLETSRTVGILTR